MNGYNAGADGKCAAIVSGSGAYDMNYLAAYQAGRLAYRTQVNLGAARAAKNQTAAQSLCGKSKGYVAVYLKAFNQKLKRYPLYIYNAQRVYIYRGATFTDVTRKVAAKQPINRANEFKAFRIGLAKSGLVRYYIKNFLTHGRSVSGYLTTKPLFVKLTYYQPADLKKGKTVRVINPKGAIIHGDAVFDTYRKQ